MTTHEAKLRMIYDLSSEAWKFYKRWNEYEMEQRDDYYWEQLVKDLNKRVNDLDRKELKAFYGDILRSYMNQLSKEHTTWLKKQQEKLAI